MFRALRRRMTPYGLLRPARIGLAAGVMLFGFAFSGTSFGATAYTVPTSITSDCSVDVTSQLLSWIATTPNDSDLLFGSGGCYRIEGTLELSGRSGLTFQGNGSTFRSLNAPADQRAMWRAIDSTGLVFRNMTIDGSYAAGGVHDPALQHAHAIDLRGTSAQVANVTMTDLAGDCVYFGRGFTAALTRSSGSVTDSTCLRIGRNAVSVTAGDDILVQRMTTGDVGYIAFDVEPNIGSGWGSERVTFDSNTIGSYFISAYSVVENAPIRDQAFTNNRVVGRGLKVTIGQTSSTLYRPANVTITGNSSDTAQAPAAMNLDSIDGLTVTGNTVPMTGGSMASINSSCTISVWGNTYPGGSGEASISPFSGCTTSPVSPAPTVAITTPSDGATVTGTRVRLAAQASSTAVRTELYVDGDLMASGSASSISCWWHIRRVAKGAHTITARAYDSSNREAVSSITVRR